jgi:hypothetical protein
MKRATFVQRWYRSLLSAIGIAVKSAGEARGKKAANTQK